jgi:hypothetical protein
MNYKLFNDDSILAPLKCGTRYLEKVFGEPSSQISSHAIGGKLFIENLQTIVVRQPFEHLSSALHTEILGSIQTNEETDIKDILDEFLSFDPLNKQNTHWDKNMYKNLYWYWRRNRERTDVIDLKDLSSYLTRLKIKKIENYDSNEYNFNHYKFWCSKEDLMLFIKTNYKKEWENLMEQVDNSNVFYNHLINKEVIEIKLI